MLATANPEINVEDLMRRIREEVAQRKAQIPPAPEAAVLWTPYAQTVVALPRLPENKACVASKPEYTLAELLNYDDDNFIRSAYRGILRREPDAVGNAHYVNMLRTGQLSKAEILGRLRYSPEGKTCAIPVRGLLLPFVMQSAYRVPVLGYGVALANFLLRLPVIIRNRVSFEANTLRQQREQVAQINALAAQIESAIGQVQQNFVKCDTEFGQRIQKKVVLAAMVEQLSRELSEKVGNSKLAALESELEAIRSSLVPTLEFETLQQKVHELSSKAEMALVEALTQKAVVAQVEALAAQTDEKILGLSQVVETKADAATTRQETREIQRQILDHKHNILDQQRRLALLLEEARKHLPAPLSTEQIENMVAEEDHLLDAFYVSFEDRFRGTREDIKQRVAIYLPIVKEAEAGTTSAPVLDIGCGRGEWLQLLRENDLVGRGVDLNRVMVSQCHELGLDVSEADAIAYLRNLKANSLGAVTGMHIIEHIPFKRLIALFDEVLRVLKPGGVAIFETPNPENLVVGACNFYYDPTHLNPLPPEPMKFVLEARGFGRIEIMRLHPQPESAMLREGDAQVQQIINGLMFGAQDYALVAFKN